MCTCNAVYTKKPAGSFDPAGKSVSKMLQLFKLFKKNRKIILNGVPDDIQPHTVIIVNQSVPHATHLVPFNIISNLLRIDHNSRAAYFLIYF